jgi:hypothetical protein
MKSVLNTFNIIYLIISTVLVGFVTAAFYLGNEETYNALKRNLPFTFFQRMLVGIMLGFMFSLFLLALNWTYNRTFGKKKGAINIRRLSVQLVMSTLTSSLVGAIIFFSAS